MGFWSERKHQKRCERAVELLKKEFGIADTCDFQGRGCDISWGNGEDNSIPFKLILYKYNHGVMVRRDFYEFYDTKWEYVGYMDTKRCLDFYWKVKGEDVKKWYGDDPRGIRNDNDKNQVAKIMEIELDEYFIYYKKLVAK